MPEAATTEDPAERYFAAITAALEGLDIFLRDNRSPLYRHPVIAEGLAEYLARHHISDSESSRRIIKEPS